jgi:uncharacterized protein
MDVPEKEQSTHVFYNVAQLLRSPIGEKRSYALDEPFGPCDEIPFASPVRGHVEMTHVNQGIVVHVTLSTTVALECARCLEAYEQRLDLSFDERFIPTVDVLTGLPIDNIEEDEDEEDVYLIDDHHILDLHEAVRQQALLNMPMQPLHAPECKGLCPLCGVNRNWQACSCHNDEPPDPRLGVLATWFVQTTPGEQATPKPATGR